MPPLNRYLSLGNHDTSGAGIGLRQGRWVLGLAIGVAILQRLAMSRLFSLQIASDSVEYLRIAEWIRQGDWISWGTWRTPFYPLILLAIRNAELLLFIQHGIGIINVLLVYGTLRRLNRGAALLAAWIAAICPYLTYLEQYALSDCWFGFFVLGGIFFALESGDSREALKPMGQRGLLALSGFCFAASCLVRPAGQFFVLILGFWIVFRNFDRGSLRQTAGKLLSQLAAFVLPLALLLTPWVLRNGSAYGVYRLSTMDHYMTFICSDYHGLLDPGSKLMQADGGKLAEAYRRGVEERIGGQWGISSLFTRKDPSSDRVFRLLNEESYARSPLRWRKAQLTAFSNALVAREFMTRELFRVWDWQMTWDADPAKPADPAVPPEFRGVRSPWQKIEDVARRFLGIFGAVEHLWAPLWIACLLFPLACYKRASAEEWALAACCIGFVAVHALYFTSFNRYFMFLLPFAAYLAARSASAVLNLGIHSTVRLLDPILAVGKRFKD